MQVTKASVGHAVLPWGTEKQQLDIGSFIFSPSQSDTDSHTRALPCSEPQAEI